MFFIYNPGNGAHALSMLSAQRHARATALSTVFIAQPMHRTSVPLPTDSVHMALGFLWPLDKQIQMKPAHLSLRISGSHPELSQE
jgi:hypothetical protein